MSRKLISSSVTAPTGARPGQRTIIKRWIAQGGRWQQHWAYLPLERPRLPQSTAGAGPIDRFLQRGIERAGIRPAPPADPRTLIRRLSLDLVGLPPTVEQVEAFVRTGASTENAVQVRVKLADGTEHKAEIIGTDPETDVALIRIDAQLEEGQVVGKELPLEPLEPRADARVVMQAPPDGLTVQQFHLYPLLDPCGLLRCTVGRLLAGGE